MIDHRDLQKITRRIVALANPESIYLFGSWAKGKMTERSDLDFLVVKQMGLARGLRSQEVTAALAEFAVDIDLIFVTPDELEKECEGHFSLLKMIMPTALLLYRRWPAPVFFCDEGMLKPGGSS